MRFLLAQLVLAALVTASQTPTVLTRSFWSGPEPESPRLPAEGFSLDFALRPATSATGPTLELLASARLPGPIAEIYGARAEGATQVVAVDSATGAVFSRPAEREGAAPLSAVIGSRPRASRTSGATIDSIEVWFNADLRSHLGLPPEAETYSVFLWLDEMTSPLRLARVPASGEPPSHASPPVIASGIHFRNSRLSPHPPEGGLVLRTGSASHPSAIIYGAADIKGLSSPNLILTVLALDSSTRQLSWRTFLVSLRDLKASGGAFEFEPAAFFRLPKGGQGRLFLAAVVPQALSNVVAVQ